MAATTAQAQLKMFRVEQDSIPFFRGFAVSFDLVGPAKLMMSDHTTSGSPSSKWVMGAPITRRMR